ncbi:MAG: S1C family serine protease [Candidatus Promineifilaceae bacterium]|jgi:S1-C subfamily serine protease
MTVLEDVSNNLADVVEAASASIVRVDARRRFPASGFVWSKDGLIVTANHVLRRDDKIGIGLADGTLAAGQLVGRDPSTDIALLRVEDSELVVLSAAADEHFKVGSLALALGRPGASIQATLGVVSAIGSGRNPQGGSQADKYIQTDVLMYPGFSGGALVAADGSLIGLNTSGLRHGASMTVPVSTLQRVLGALLQHGRVRRGYLGVSTQIVRLQEEIRTELGQKTGLLIVAVEPGSPADDAGFKIGDTIVKVGSTEVRRHEDLLAELTNANFEEKTPVTIVRGGEIQTLTVKIGEQTD